MKLNGETVAGLRGAPSPVELELAGKSCALLAENGFGKTTLAGGIELWSSGDLGDYHREGCDLPAAIHVDADQAVVELDIQGHGAFRRTLSKDGVGPITPVGPVPADREPPAGVPLLRHSTIADFMRCTSGDKRKALLELLDLDGLNGFREALVTACNNAKRRAESAETALRREQDLLGGTDAETAARADALRSEARIGTAITSVEDLRRLDLDAAPVAASPDRVGAVADLIRALAELPEDPAAPWNNAVADHSAVAAVALTTLISAGERALDVWPHPTCPLCENDVNPDALRVDLGRRSLEYKEAKNRLDGARSGLEGRVSGNRKVLDALNRLLRVAPADGWPHEDRLEAARDTLELQQDHLGRAMRETIACVSCGAIELWDTYEALKAAATNDLRDKSAKALVQLISLRDQARRVQAAETEAAALRRVHAALDRLKTIAEKAIESAIALTLEQLGAVAADYYGRLTNTYTYSDVRLTYRASRGGQVEFEFVYDGRVAVRPPQRVMSESQLHALGLSLFLARLKLSEQPWRTLVLDDVVGSFDANCRSGLARLLAEEFSDWQILVFTHDQVFYEILRRTVGKGWVWKEIQGWTPAGGPVISDGDPLTRLRERLEAGQSASDLGGLARVVVEEGLARPLHKLGYRVRYDPQGRHSAWELFTELRRGLREAKSPLADIPVLNRIEGDTYLSNFGAHYQQSTGGLTVSDLRRLVDDFEELASAFVCANCEQPVWAAETTKRKHQCRCSALAA